MPTHSPSPARVLASVTLMTQVLRDLEKRPYTSLSQSEAHLHNFFNCDPEFAGFLETVAAIAREEMGAAAVALLREGALS